MKKLILLLTLLLLFSSAHAESDPKSTLQLVAVTKVIDGILFKLI